MRRKYLLPILIIVFSFTADAQKYDNKWMLGYNYGPGFAQPALDFYFGYPDTIGYYGTIEMFGNNASICNSQGLLQFYTNGLLVSNAWDQPLSNSSGFNSSVFTNTVGYTYLPVNQGVVILPDPGNQNQYYLFHHNIEQSGNNIQPTELRLSKIDMQLQNGLGEMTVKNQVIINDQLTLRTLNAVKHGNGRDWWIVIGENGTDQFYSILLTPVGVDTIISSGNGPVITNGLFRGQSVFSPDGNHYAYTTFDLQGQNKIVLYDFDRCTGEFVYNDSVHFSNINDSLLTGCSFSPTSNYLYACTYTSLYQFDLVNNNLDAVNHIDDFDYFVDFIPLYFGQMQLGPDNKIYMINSGGTTRYFHVINNPDLPVTQSDFVQHQLRVTGYHSGTIPFYPHYRLGPATGSGCDSLTVTALNESYNDNLPYCYSSQGKILLYTGAQSKTTGTVSVYSVSGALINNVSVPAGSDDNIINAAEWIRSPGIYIVKYVKDNACYSWRIPVIYY